MTSKKDSAIVSVKNTEPQFKGQTKGELGNSDVKGIVSRAVGDALKIYLEENPAMPVIIEKWSWRLPQDMLLEKHVNWSNEKMCWQVLAFRKTFRL